MENRIAYSIGIGCVLIAIWSVLMGGDKMIKLIISNFIIGSICFAFGESLQLGMSQLLLNPEGRFLGISYEGYANFLSNGQFTFTIILFALLVWLAYSSSKIQVQIGSDEISEKLIGIVLIPLTVLSFIFGLYIALMGNGLHNMERIQNAVSEDFAFISSFIANLPLRMLGHGLIVMAICNQIKFNVSFKSKSTTLPEGLGEL
ncbi:MAG: hypothetical protein PHU61_03810 [Candidatus Absconditabacteria bacterium]|nr:hypothetical protein [Candidatus Absconditabacteria bacterium]MDD3868596.1 hypothetical protein [Candidatus Absconditabacteria bacterium]MDD4714735.1 hypothetical protein [Candidatus Absconditabacteria bacterium]